MAIGKGIEAGKAYVKAYLEDSAFRRGLASMGRGLKDLGPKLVDVGKSMGVAGAAVTAPLLAAVKVFSDIGGEIADMSARTGVGVEALSELQFAAEQSGASAEDLEKGLRGMQRTLFTAERGSKETAKTLADLGLSFEELRGKRPEEQFAMFADAVSRVEDPGRRAALAMKVFGKSGVELLPLMSDGAAGIEELRQKARELGITLSTEDVRAAEEFGDKLDVLKRVGLVKLFEIGAAIAPVLGELAERLASNGRAAGVWIKENRTLVEWVFKIGAAVVAVGGLLTGFGYAFTGVATAIAAVKTGGMLLAANLPALGAALAAVAIGYFAYQVYQANAAVRDLNRQIAISKNLDTKVSRQQERRRGKVGSDAAAIADPAERKAFIAKAIADAEREAAGARASAGGAQTWFDGLVDKNVGWTGRALATDGKLIDEAEEEAKVAAANADAAERHVDSLRDLLDQTEREQAIFSAAAAVPGDEAPAAAGGSSFLAAWDAGVDKLVGGIEGAAETLGLIAPKLSAMEWLEQTFAGGETADDGPAAEAAASEPPASSDAINRALAVDSSEGMEAVLKAITGGKAGVTPGEKLIAGSIDSQTSAMARQHREALKGGGTIKVEKAS